ncbi:MAG: DUF5060 domain-containing protein [Armatimonadota bacterium]|nr:DUF5060 domain-containing protein [Armatimonadota bacterium]
MRIAMAVALVAMALPLAAHAQRLVRDGEDYVWRDDGRVIRFTPPGIWRVGLEGGPETEVSVVLWHGEWQYERLAGGGVTDGPHLTEDGSVSLAGHFVRKQDAPPMEFEMRLEPGEDGLSVDLWVTKTGELALRRGVLALMRMSRDDFGGEEPTYLRPGSYGTTARGVDGVGTALGVGITDEAAISLAPTAPGHVSWVAREDFWEARVRLTPDDFPAGEQVNASFELAFEPIPQPLPGEIVPSRQPLAIRGVTPATASVPVGRHTELTVDLDATWDNPFDPEDVALDAVVQTPSGQRVEVPSFFMLDMQRDVIGDAELLTPVGDGRWCVRFSPTEEGEHRFRLRARDRSGEVIGGEGSFVATARDGHGFVRVSEADPHYFAFDDSSGYFPIGHNLPIYHQTGQLGPEAMAKMAAAGESYNRWWMSSRGLGIESEHLGRYRQPQAWRLDYLLEQARELGMYYMLCLDTHQDFRGDGWLRNPYNAINGGPCETAGDFFTSDRARELYRKRLRYIVARWGYSPHVLCWEFGNEMQGWADSSPEDQLSWHAEMSRYLRSIDPWDHLITTSFWGGTGDERFWALEDIDIVQTHNYGNAELGYAEIARGFCRQQWERWPKPHLFAEFGLSARAGSRDLDREGWAIHNALWAATMSGCAGGPMPWWHESYIDPLDLYFHFTAMARFVEKLPLGETSWRPLGPASLEYQEGASVPEPSDVIVPTFHRWGRPEHSEFIVQPDGSIADDRRVQSLLQGQAHEDLRNPPTFVAEYPSDGRFIVHVERVSAGGDLSIYIDDRLALREELATGEGLGVESVWREQWQIWETVYDREIAVDVPAGRHRIRVENTGRDWIRVSRYMLTGLRTHPRPNVMALGMVSDSATILWLHNRDSVWHRHADEEPGPVVPSFLATFQGLPDGECRLERWDTWQGRRSYTSDVLVANGTLTIELEELRTDVAYALLPAD